MARLKVQFSSLSFGASVDQQTGNLSVFDLIEEIRTPQVPVHIQSLVISVALEKLEPVEHVGKILIHFLTPDGKQQPVGSGELRVPPEQKRMKAVFRFGGFPLAMMGMHRFVISFVDQQNTKVAESVLDFEVSQAPQIAEGVPPPAGRSPGLAH